MDNMTNVKCYKCRADLNIEKGSKIMRSESCEKCGTSIRCCRMCIHFEPSSYNECREDVAERIVDKEKANFCDYYVFCENKSNKDDEKDRHMDTANSLFK